MSTPEERLQFLGQVHDQSLELLRGVSFDKHPRRDGYLVCLYASMIELAGGIVLLVHNDRKTAMSPVFRTFVEAYVDLKNVAEDRIFVEHSFARHHKDWIKILGANGESNRFLGEVNAHEKRQEALKRHERELEKLRDQGVHPLKVAERFARAGMSDEYFALYHFESDAIHNSSQALLGRHVEETRGDDFGLTLYKQRSLEDYDSYMDAAAVLLLDATRIVHEQINSGKQDDIQRLSQKLDAIRPTAPSRREPDAKRQDADKDRE
jgi:hypothetical protein